MYDWNSPLISARNLYAGAKAVGNSEDEKWVNETEPFLTSGEPLPRRVVQEYGSGLRPSLIVWADDSRVAVAIAGIQGAADAMEVYRGYLRLGSVAGMSGSVNVYAKTWYEASLQTILPYLRPTTQEVLFFGHSWGGTTATMLAHYAKTFNRNMRVKLATFGTPRFATRDFLDAMRIDEWCRVMNYADVVPYICPWFTEAPAFHMLHGPIDVYNMNRVTHMTNGIRIRSGAGLAYHEYPEGLSLPLDMNPFAMRAILASGIQPHLANTYRDVLYWVLQDLEPRLHRPEGNEATVRAEPPNPVTHDAAVQIADFPLTNWPTNAVHPRRPRPEAPAIEPFTPVLSDAPEAGRVRVRKEYGTWYVKVAGRTVYKATGQRDAKGFARALRMMGTQYEQNPGGVIGIDTLIEEAAGHVPLQQE